MPSLFSQAQSNRWGSLGDGFVFSNFDGLQDDEILRQLEIGSVTGVGSDGSAAIGESLDTLVKSVTKDPDTFANLFQRTYNYTAKAINEEFIKLKKLGRGMGSFRQQTKLGRQDASQIERLFNTVKFLGQVGGVGLEYADASRATMGDMKAFEIVSRLKDLILNINRDMIWADDQTNPLAWKGLFQQSLTDSEHLTDLVVTGTAGTRTTYVSGGVVSPTLFAETHARMIKFGARQTAVLLSPLDKHILSDANQNKTRYYIDTKQESRIADRVITDILNTDFGPLELVWEFYLMELFGREAPFPLDPSKPNEVHPDAPAVLATVPTGVASPGGFLPPAQFFYAVVPNSEVSEGLPVFTAGVTTNNTDGTNTLTITNPSNAEEFAKVKSYRVFRSTRPGNNFSNFEILGEVAKTGTAGGTMAFVDDGSIIPGSRKAMQMNEMQHAIGMLRPPTMRDLPMSENVDLFTIDCHAVVQNYAVEQTHTFRNIGGQAIQP